MRVLASFFAIASLLSLTPACSGSSDGDPSAPADPKVAKACADTEEAFVQAAVRCGATYDTVKAEFDKAIGGGCANIGGIRDEVSLRATCLPAYSTISCPDLTAGKLDAACLHQLQRIK